MILDDRQTLDSAVATFRDNAIDVSTGELRRRWLWTGSGFQTVGLWNEGTDHGAGYSWPLCSDRYAADWVLPGCDEGQEATLDSVQIEESTDSGFTSKHLRVRAEMTYPAAARRVRFEIWVYPNSPGIRTQLSALSLPGFVADGTRFTDRAEYLPVVIGPEIARRPIGYYNETQQRNDTGTDILEEEIYDHSMSGPEWYRWPSILCLEDGRHGIAVVQESHKCPNQRGHDTGLFRIHPDRGLISMGWGLLPRELCTDRFREGWARWTVLWTGGDLARETALKRFDEIRYPIDPARDIYTIANTWGSSTDRASAIGAAAEEVVREEIDSQADLGIDIQQIDDGWQGDGYDSWKPVPSRYAKGWGPVRAYAKEKGVKLGLWAAAVPIPLEDLKENYDAGGFLQFKLDFAVLRNRDDIESLFSKVREFILYTDHAVRVNWDVTENPPRYGYFLGREYGSLYLENRKPAWPHSAVYIPHTVLRDVWQLAKYINLSKVQCSIQNIDRVDRDLSDAYLHNHPYCVAIALMGTPIFFQRTALYSDAARDSIRPLLSAYKEHRDKIYGGLTYPIGAKPNNRSWTGFQCVAEGGREGYLMVFRELYNENSTCRIALRFLENASIKLADVMTGEETTIVTDGEGFAQFAIRDTPDFRFYHYVLE